jgi:hypothetical protein
MLTLAAHPREIAKTHLGSQTMDSPALMNPSRSIPCGLLDGASPGVALTQERQRRLAERRLHGSKSLVPPRHQRLNLTPARAELLMPLLAAVDLAAPEDRVKRLMLLRWR